MVIVSRGHGPSPADLQLAADEFRLFVQQLDLVLARQSEILGNKDLLFCPLSFAWCSWPYVSGDGPLCLGYLLLAWNKGILTEPCSECGGKVLVTSFGGSPLSGSCSWTGICMVCLEKRSARGSVHTPFASKIAFVSELRRCYPDQVCQWQEYDGFEFSWGGTGLTPALKRKPVWVKLAEPLSLHDLIERLQDSTAIEQDPPNVCSLHKDLHLKFGSN